MHPLFANRTQHRQVWLCAILTLLCLPSAWAQTQVLFESHASLELRMPVDFDSLCRPSQDPECDYTGTSFEYQDEDGAAWSIPVQILRRDGWRAQQTNCQIPTLFVRFQPETVQGTVFEGQTTLALTSHCGKGLAAGRTATLPDEFERYVTHEYLGYRLYNLVTDTSLKVRLVTIEYVHPTSPRRSMKRNAFFAEHFDALAARKNAPLVSTEDTVLEQLDTHAADQLALFQFMIGNTDWSIAEQNNVIVLGQTDGTQVPVLYDLDQSGLVNAHYAIPPEGVPIDSVKQRHFMGTCHADTDWDALFEKFRRLAPQMLELLHDTPTLGRGDRRAVESYLEGFFDVLVSEQSRQAQIINACLP